MISEVHKFFTHAIICGNFPDFLQKLATLSSPLELQHTSTLSSDQEEGMAVEVHEGYWHSSKILARYSKMSSHFLNVKKMEQAKCSALTDTA